MSGHSKWATIKRKKATLDAKRGKEFTKISKEISVAAKLGGNPAGNPRLRALIDKARAANMPVDNITRAIQRGTGELPGVSYEEHHYEGYGPNGIAVMIDALTDNKNRTVADLRRFFSSKGGNLGEAGSVNWMFKLMGVIRASGKATEDELIEELIDFDIKDISCDQESCMITMDPKSLDKAKQKLENLAFKIETAQPEMVAQNSVHLSGEQAEKAEEFLSEIDDMDDVQNVYTNFVIDE